MDGRTTEWDNEYLSLIDELTLESNDAYSIARHHMLERESEYREPITNVNEVLPATVENKPMGMSPTEWTAYVSNKELAYLMDPNTKDLTGRILLDGESKMIGNELSRYAKRLGVDRRCNGGFSNEPTPAEERALEILMYNPLADEDNTIKDLVGNADVMRFGARYVINSPYLSIRTKTQAFNTSPENAIESQSLNGVLVNKAITEAQRLSNGSRVTRHRILHAAFHHPHIDPDLAFMVMQNIYNSDEWTPGQKEGFDWQLALNPNPNVARRIAELDWNTPVADQLMITKNWVLESSIE